MIKILQIRSIFGISENGFIIKYKKTSITLTSLVNIFGIKKTVEMLGCP